jgi:hypothetical protein
MPTEIKADMATVSPRFQCVCPYINEGVVSVDQIPIVTRVSISTAKNV